MDLVRLVIVQNEIEAEQIRSLLSFEGIESMSRQTDYGAIPAGLSASGAHEILVKPDDLETAQALIDEPPAS